MHRTRKIWWLGAVLVVAVLAALAYLSSVNIPVLEPKGVIADKEFRLLLVVTGVMLIVVVPVFILLGYIVYRYRDTNKKKKTYSPDWDHDLLIEGVWWLIPTAIIAVLAVITWNATYALNPYKPIVSSNQAINVEVVAMDWKWLFIYPNLNVASVNQVTFPQNTPVHFYLTSDAPMNSFWIPQLSGQIYCMPGMQTQLYLMASVRGTFNGWSANISGIGFAGMQFSARSVSSAQFKTWVANIKSTAPALSIASYNQLSHPSSYNHVAYFSKPQANLFNDIMIKYMAPNAINGMVM